MKLVIYIPTLDSGGVERLHLNLAPLWLEAGYDVTFLLHRAKGSLMTHVPPGVRVLSFDRGRALACLLPMVGFLRREKPDILLSNMGHNNILALWAVALARARTRVIVSQHNTLSAETSGKVLWQYRIMPLLCRLFLGNAHGIIAVSRGVADDLAAMTGVRRERVSVIYNPVIVDDFDARMAEPGAHPWLGEDGPPFLLGVGRLLPPKDFPTLIEAFARVARLKNIRLIVLGEGPLRESLMRFARAQGVADRVSFAGFHENPLPFMRKARALVMSSRHEGFGNVLAEALACGTNIVSTDCPYGPAEILENGKFGRLVPVGNAQALAEGILAALENPLPAAMLMERGRSFTVRRASAEYGRLFEQVLTSSGPAS